MKICLFIDKCVNLLYSHSSRFLVTYITSLFSRNKCEDILSLKLDSGYNIGIPKENILAGRVLKKYKEEKEEFKMHSGKDLPKIGMIITGGRIAAKLDSKTGGVSWLTDVNEFARFYPEIFKIVNVIQGLSFR